MFETSKHVPKTEKHCCAFKDKKEKKKRKRNSYEEGNDPVKHFSVLI